MGGLGTFLKVFMAPLSFAWYGRGHHTCTCNFENTKGQFLRKQKGQQAPSWFCWVVEGAVPGHSSSPARGTQKTSRLSPAKVSTHKASRLVLRRTLVIMPVSRSAMFHNIGTLCTKVADYYQTDMNKRSLVLVWC